MPQGKLDIKEGKEGVRFIVHVAPRASRSEFMGLHGDAMKVRLAAPPVDGAANDELIAFLSKFIGVPKSAVAIIAGETSKRKTVRISGINAASITVKIDR
ncbi:MAG: YggU family protein [Nitrospinae bacterium]|nr:YggU family protein [Nitrospinota bacterium]